MRIWVVTRLPNHSYIHYPQRLNCNFFRILAQLWDTYEQRMHLLFSMRSSKNDGRSTAVAPVVFGRFLSWSSPNKKKTRKIKIFLLKLRKNSWNHKLFTLVFVCLVVKWFIRRRSIQFRFTIVVLLVHINFIFNCVQTTE